MAVELGRLEQEDPRGVWAHEAHDFTPWLLRNADRLSEALGVDVEFEAAEHLVGAFKLDLLGRDLTNDARLIVENQLAPTDHTHFGQVLTYAAGTAASTIVWIATAFREEHRQALVWLNENTGEDIHFFGIELQVVRIGESQRAPLLNVVVEPNDWQKRIRADAAAASGSGRAALYRQFWSRFLERVHAEHPGWTQARKATQANWMDIPAPLRGTHFSFSFAQKERLRAEIYVDSGDALVNSDLFSSLLSRREQFEAAYGRPLSWEELPERRASRIADYKEGCSVTNSERVDDFIDWLFDSCERFRKALEVMG